MYLEVLKEENSGIWILEKFAGNEVYSLVDLRDMQLIELYGFDRNGNRHDIELLNNNEVDQRIEKMKGLSSFMKDLTHIEEWDVQETKKDVETKFGNMNCTVLKPIFTESVKNEMNETDKNNMNTKEVEFDILFSNSIPKLIPFEFTAPLIANLSVLEDIDGGLVKNSKLELKTLKNKG